MRRRLAAMTDHLRPWREWTLRTRLVAAMAVLTALALIGANIAGAVLLRSYLVNRVDQQLVPVARADQDRIERGGGPLPSFRGRFLGRLIGPDVRIGAMRPDGTMLDPATGEPVPRDPNPGPILGYAWLSAHDDGKPRTVDGSDGSPWRVVALPDPTTNSIHFYAVSLHDVTTTSTNLLVIDGVVTVVVLVMLGLAASSVVRIGLRPLTRMEETATEIAGTDDLSRRVEDVDPHTESGRLGTALNAMLVRVEAALGARTASERRLRQFLADASHELRTPLTSIQGFAELYRRGGTPPGPQLDEAMGAIESEVGRMRVLVNDLLLLARLDEERPMATHPVDLLGVAAETVRDAHVRVPTRFVQLAALDDAFQTFEPVQVTGDEDRLRQVATNLVSNALQHTGDNTRIVVRVGRSTAGSQPPPAAAIGRPLEPGSPVAVLEVEDTGPGLAAEDAERVFERLFRADPSRARRFGGAGLGLAIVAAIVQAHGGRVELFTEVGAGARFRVLLPVEAGDADGRDDADPDSADADADPDSADADADRDSADCEADRDDDADVIELDPAIPS